MLSQSKIAQIVLFQNCFKFILNEISFEIHIIIISSFRTQAKSTSIKSIIL